MHVSKRTALAVAGVAAIAFAVPSFADQGHQNGGAQSTGCADGTVTWNPSSIWWWKCRRGRSAR